jgi:integrase
MAVAILEEKREPKLLERVRDALCVRHMSLRTEKAYVHWIRRYILFHGKRHPREMGEVEINGFLTHLAVEGQVSASTQTQALCALLFLYRTVLEKEVGELEGLVRAKRRRKLPVVLTVEEVKKILSSLEREDRIFLSLLYGTGMRLLEGVTPPGEGRRLLLRPDHHPGRQGSQGPGDDVAGVAQGGSAGAPEEGQASA